MILTVSDLEIDRSIHDNKIKIWRKKLWLNH